MENTAVIASNAGHWRGPQPVGQHAGRAKPHERRDQRQIEWAPGVIIQPVDRAVGDIRTHRIQQRSRKKMRIDFAPGALRAPHQKCETAGQRDVFHRSQMVIAPSVTQHVRSDVLPGNYDEEIEIHPPDQQQRKIQISRVHVEVIATVVRFQSQCANHRNRMQEQDDIADEWVWGVLVQHHFEVRPDRLANQPRRASQPK